MYYYFDDKQDLYITVLSDAIENFLEAMDPPSEFAGPEDFWAKMRTMYASGLRFLVDHPRAAALARSFVSAPRGAETLPQVDELNTKAHKWMKGLVQVGQSLGAIRTDVDAEVIAMAAFSLGESMNNFAIDQLPNLNIGDEVALQAWVERTAEVLLDMIARLARP